VIFVDTSYLVAIILPSDGLHRRAMEWTNVVDEPLLVTEFVLLETVNSLSRPQDRAPVHAALDQIAADTEWKVIPSSPHWFHLGLARHRQRSDKEWSLTDCISFCVMDEHGIRRALTHDHHFEQAGFEALLRQRPDG
jgi:uncharacterized protein